jgi:Zn-dependent M28 family amino/carboxypeptidase
VPLFDGARALEDVRLQVTSGNGGPLYRIPGTAGNDEVARLITERMSGLGYATSWHWFNATYACETLAMHNIVAERAGTSGRIVVFAAHYDTRPIADKDPDTAMRSEPVLGANDGASGVAVLLELARVLPPSDDTVRFLFFDGEDGGGYKGARCTDWILGSRAYAESLPQSEIDAIDALILVDMVGDRDLVIPREGNTAGDMESKRVQDALYAAGRVLGHEQFTDARGLQITDDHVPFLEREVPAVDLIHTIPGDPRVFPAWHHTLADDLDSVSANSLNAVGEGIEAWSSSRWDVLT